MGSFSILETPSGDTLVHEVTENLVERDLSLGTVFEDFKLLSTSLIEDKSDEDLLMKDDENVRELDFSCNV